FDHWRRTRLSSQMAILSIVNSARAMADSRLLLRPIDRQDIIPQRVGSGKTAHTPTISVHRMYLHGSMTFIMIPTPNLTVVTLIFPTTQDVPLMVRQPVVMQQGAMTRAQTYIDL